MAGIGADEHYPTCSTVRVQIKGQRIARQVKANPDYIAIMVPVQYQFEPFFAKYARFGQSPSANFAKGTPPRLPQRAADLGERHRHDVTGLVAHRRIKYILEIIKQCLCRRGGTFCMSRHVNLFYMTFSFGRV